MFLTLRYLYQQIHESFQYIGGGPGNGGMPDMASMMQMMQGMGMGGGEDGGMGGVSISDIWIYITKFFLSI